MSIGKHKGQVVFIDRLTRAEADEVAVRGKGERQLGGECLEGRQTHGTVGLFGPHALLRVLLGRVKADPSA